MNVDDALEVAKLAAFAGGQLKKIDQFSTERSNNPANKINMNNFIRSVQNPRASVPAADYLVKPPPGFAAPPPFEAIEAEVPDISINSVKNYNAPIQQSAVLMSQPEPVPPPLPTPIQATPTQPSKIPLKDRVSSIIVDDSTETPLVSNSDIISIKNSLKNIDKTLHKMLILFQSNK